MAVSPPAERPRPAPRRPAREELRRFALGGAFVVALVLVVQFVARQAEASSSPVAAGTLVLGLGLAAAVFFGIARDSSVGVICWLFFALFTGIYSNVPIERLTFAALVAGWFIAIVTHRRPLRAFGVTELLMVIFLAIEIGSVIAPHALPASTQLTPGSIITRGALFPFMLFVIARQTMTDRRAVRSFLYFTVFAGSYTALMAIFYKFGPHALVFPREILNPDLGINPERGRGPLLNSAADGLTMVAGLICAAFLVVQPGIRFKRLIIASILILPLGIYLTQTRAIWLATGLAVVLGVMFANGFRRWYVIVLALAVTFIGINWQKFLSSDRTQGGVTSEGEIESRLNDWATALWALDKHKVFGWGISRFPDVNTLHHQAWGTVDWNLGYGFLGHNTHLATAAELGYVGLVAWARRPDLHHRRDDPGVAAAPAPGADLPRARLQLLVRLDRLPAQRRDHRHARLHRAQRALLRVGRHRRGGRRPRPRRDARAGAGARGAPAGGTRADPRVRPRDRLPDLAAWASRPRPGRSGAGRSAARGPG